MAFVDKLKKFFNLTSVKPQNATKDAPPLVIPDSKPVKDLYKNGRDPGLNSFRTEKNLKSYLKDLWDAWMSDTYDTPASLKNRFDRYDDLDYMYFNDTIISMAVDLYADETIQYDSQTKPIIVNAPKKAVSKYINNFFDEIGLDQATLRAIAFDLALYGDSFAINGITSTGVDNFTTLDVRDVTERLEFNPSKVNTETLRLHKKWVNAVTTKYEKLRQLSDTVNETENISEYFKSYLFGFAINENITLPPWAVTHFRLLNNSSEFYPYGRPLLINSISTFRKLMAAKNLMALARAASMPIQHFKVKADENMTTIEKWQAVQETQEQYYNVGVTGSNKENFSVGSSIWTIEDSLSLENLDTNIDTDKIADIELIRDDLIMGTRIPKGYLIIDSGGWGQSGQSLLQQHKPFARYVYTIQTSILKELVKLVKIQFMIDESAGFDPDETEFELAMNFPVVEESSDKMRANLDSVTFAKDVLATFKETLGIEQDTSLPAELVSYIFSKFSFLTAEDVEYIVDELKKQEEALGTTKISGFEEAIEKGISRIKEVLLEKGDSEFFTQIEFDAKKNTKLTEGVLSKKHFINSNLFDEEFEHIRKHFEFKGDIPTPKKRKRI